MSKTKTKEEERTWNAADATVAATPADLACPEDDEEDAEDLEEDMPLLADDSEAESSSGSSDHFRGEQTT